METTYATIEAFAERLSVHPNTIKSWLKRGLPSVKVGSVRRILVERADAWLAGESTPNAPVTRTRTRRPT